MSTVALHCAYNWEFCYKSKEKYAIWSAASMSTHLSLLLRRLSRCDVSAAAQRIVGQDSQKSKLAWILHNVTRCNRMSWYCFCFCSLGQKEYFSGTLDSTVGQVWEGFSMRWSWMEPEKCCSQHGPLWLAQAAINQANTTQRDFIEVLILNSPSGKELNNVTDCLKHLESIFTSAALLNIRLG